ncbi:ABC-type transport auxiliary lipoprotein family protein [Sulfurimonas sp.]
MKIIILIGALFLSACTTTLPPVQEYRIAPKLELQNKKVESSCKNYSLKVSQVFGNSFLKSTDMNYVVGEYKELSFTQSAWSDTLAKLLTSQILSTLRKADIYNSVESYRSRSSANYVLESSVNDFMQYFSKDEKKSYVVVDITMSLIDVKNSTVVATKRFYKKLDTKKANAQSGVEALNSAFEAVLMQSIIWLQGSCK